MTDTGSASKTLTTAHERSIRRRMEVLRDMEGDPLPRAADWRAFYVHDVMVLLDELERLRYEVSSDAAHADVHEEHDAEYLP